MLNLFSQLEPKLAVPPPAPDWDERSRYERISLLFKAKFLPQRDVAPNTGSEMVALPDAEYDGTFLKWQAYEMMAAIGVKPIGPDKAARIFAALHVLGGGHSCWTDNPKWLRDLFWAFDFYDIRGGCEPDAEVAELVQYYSKQFPYEVFWSERPIVDMSNGNSLSQNIISWACPQWVWDLVKEYGLEKNIVISQGGFCL